MDNQDKVRSQTMKRVMVIMPNERIFDAIFEELENHLPHEIELRYANFWRELEDEARTLHQDVIVYFPKDDDSALAIRRSMTEAYLACPEASGILVTATDMKECRDPFHTEVQLSAATANIQMLASEIKKLLAKHLPSPGTKRRVRR